MAFSVALYCCLKCVWDSRRTFPIMCARPNVSARFVVGSWVDALLVAAVLRFSASSVVCSFLRDSSLLLPVLGMEPSCCAVLAYQRASFVVSQTSKQFQYSANTIHSYLVFIPVLCFLCGEIESLYCCFRAKNKVGAAAQLEIIGCQRNPTKSPHNNILVL